MATLVEEMRHKLQVQGKEIEEFAATFNADNLPTEDDERKLDAMMNGQADLREQLARAEKFDGVAAPAKANGHRPPPPAAQGGRQPLITLGQRFINDEGYKAALAQYAPDGRIPERGNFKMPAMSIKGMSELGMLNPQSALITGGSDTSGGAFIISDRQAEMVTLGRRPITILDLIRTLQTGSDLVEYVAQTSRTNNAAAVDEATASDDGSGVKPESAAAFVVRTAPVVTIANWIPVTKQAVADVPQMRGIIDTELRDNLRETLSDKVVNSSSGMIGLLQTSGRQTQAWSSNILTTTRKAKTIVSTVGRAIAEAYVLNPADWETIDLLQDNEARYFYGGPAQVGTPRLWGLPVAEEEAVATGTGIVGQLTKAILWDREQASLSISDSHADFFIRNLLAMLAELRAAFALTQPSAIVEIDLTA